VITKTQEHMCTVHSHQDFRGGGHLSGEIMRREGRTDRTNPCSVPSNYGIKDEEDRPDLRKTVTTRDRTRRTDEDKHSQTEKKTPYSDFCTPLAYPPEGLRMEEIGTISRGTKIKGKTRERTHHTSDNLRFLTNGFPSNSSFRSRKPRPFHAPA
jgi:hypothetical protein